MDLEKRLIELGTSSTAPLDRLVVGEGRYFRTAINALGENISTTSTIPLKRVDNYQVVPDYQLEAYVHDPGIRWEDYTADWGHGATQGLRGYMYPFSGVGARNPYRGDNYSESVTSHEIRHYNNHRFGGDSVDEEREVRRAERYQGTGDDHLVKL